MVQPQNQHGQRCRSRLSSSQLVVRFRAKSRQHGSFQRSGRVELLLARERAAMAADRDELLLARERAAMANEDARSYVAQRHFVGSVQVPQAVLI